MGFNSGFKGLKLAEVVITYTQTRHMLKDWPCGSSSKCNQITVHYVPWHVLQARRNTSSLNHSKVKVKQSHYRPTGFQEVEAPRFQENWHMKVVRLSALRTGRLYHRKIFLVLISVTGCQPQGHGAAGFYRFK